MHYHESVRGAAFMRFSARHFSGVRRLGDLSLSALKRRERRARSILESAVRALFSNQTESVSEQSWLEEQSSANEIVTEGLCSRDESSLARSKDNSQCAAKRDAMHRSALAGRTVVYDGLERRVLKCPSEDCGLPSSQIPRGQRWSGRKVWHHPLSASSCEPLRRWVVRRASFDLPDNAGRDDQARSEPGEEIDVPNLGEQDDGGGVDDPAKAHASSFRPVLRESPGSERRQNAPGRG
jgi:hypothetical protein